MRLFFIFFAILTCSVSQASPKFSREWSRSTLDKPHYLFRYLNKMAPILTENLVIQGNAVDGIKAFDRKSGHEQWSLELKNGVEGGAAISGDKLYFGAGNGQFYCVNALDGKILWSYPLNSESLTRPLVQGTRVFHVTGNNNLYAFEKDSGRSLWVKTQAAKSNMTVRGQTAPAFENGSLYVGFSDGTFSAFNAENGRSLWSKRIGDDKKFNDVDATAKISSQCVLVASYANSLYCLDKRSGSILWRHDVGGYNSVTLNGDRIYYPTVKGEIHILDNASGKLLKKIVNLKGLATEITLLDNNFIYGESSGAVIVRDQKSLAIKTSFSPGRGIFARITTDPKTKELFFISNEANLFKLKYAESHKEPFPWSGKF